MSVNNIEHLALAMHFFPGHNAAFYRKILFEAKFGFKMTYADRGFYLEYFKYSYYTKTSYQESKYWIRKDDYTYELTPHGQITAIKAIIKYENGEKLPMSNGQRAARPTYQNTKEYSDQTRREALEDKKQYKKLGYEKYWVWRRAKNAEALR